MFQLNLGLILLAASALITLVIVTIKLKRAQRAFIDESLHRDRLERALDSAKMGIWDVDRVTGKITWSRYHEILFGYKPGTFDGTSEGFRSRVHPEDLPKILKALQTSVQNHCEYQCEIRVIHPDKSVRWVLGRGMPYYDPSGSCIRMMGTIVETTERKKAEEQLIHVMDELRKANSYKDQFLANISHDIRTPLSAVIGYSEILLNQSDREDLSGEDTSKYLIRIKENARQLLQQIDGVIQYIQADTGNFKVVRNRTHISDLIAGICSGSRISAKGHEVEIFSRVDSNEDVIITDSFIVSTIIEQLIDYSLRHTDAEFIFIQTFVRTNSSEHGILEVVIKDTGRQSTDHKSMASFALHSLQTADPDTNPGGLEVGLPLACKLASILEGKITSTPALAQRGSEFTISLPISFPKSHVSSGTGILAEKKLAESNDFSLLN